MTIKVYKLLLIDGNYKQEILITPDMLYYAKYPDQIIGQLILNAIDKLSRKESK